MTELVCPFCKIKTVNRVCQRCGGGFLSNGKFVPHRESGLVRRTIHPQIRVLDEKRGLVEYVASDETIDSYREVIRANGWRFDQFRKNAPFCDSHHYDSLDCLVGKIVDFKVEGGKLVETAQWAIDVVENQLAQLGFRMTVAGYLKAVSVGFVPEQMISRWNKDNADVKPIWQQQLRELGLTDKSEPRAIYLRQQQVELSSCIIGANPNALAKSFKAGVLKDDDLDFLSREFSYRETANLADEPGAGLAQDRAREEFLRKFEQLTKRL